MPGQNDLALFTDMLTRARIGFEKKDHKAGFDVLISADGGENNGGYAGFSAVFEFDKEGVMKGVGIGEG